MSDGTAFRQPPATNGPSVPAASDTGTAPDPKAPPSTIYIYNLSPCEVTIEGKNTRRVLPPLGEEMLAGGGLDAFDMAKLEASPYVEVDDGIVVDDSVVYGFVMLVAIVGAPFLYFEWHRWIPVFVWFVACIGGGYAIAQAVRRRQEALRWMRQTVSLFAVLIVGFAIPCLVLVFGTGIYDQLRTDAGSVLDTGAVTRVVLYRFVQAVFLGLAATFPVLLYFLFDRQSMRTLRAEFLRALFRLDPTIANAADWRALYGNQVDGAFGPLGRHATRKGVLHTRNSPLGIATIVLAIGWVLAFLNSDILKIGGPDPIDSSPLALFVPEQQAVAFGFLGAYFFTVQTVLRSYMRADLRPKAYSQITARILIVVVVCALVSVTTWGDSPAVLAIAFFAGVLPESILQWVWESVQQTVSLKAKLGDDVVERQPLTELDGIDIYDRSRLAEEGVTNVEALAHGDLIDLMLQTRIAPGRLVDWVDQAVLRVQLADQDLLQSLRKLGIRTATDLYTAIGSNKAALLTALGGDEKVRDAQLDLLRQALGDAEWICELSAWRINEERGRATVDAVPV